MHIVFGLTVHDEPEAQIDWCLTWLRRAYPAAPVFVVSDGPHPEESAVSALCRCHRVHFERGARLKVIEQGAAWWHRFFTVGASYHPDWLAKLDADTRVRRALDLTNVAPAAVLGKVDNIGRPYENVQGGFQLIRGAAVERILRSGECLSARWRDPASWARGECGGLIARGEISTDFTLMAILRTLGLDWACHDEVDSHWHAPRAWRRNAAVTHPHKGMTAADAAPPGVSFCTTCYNRLSFLQQTLPRNLAALDPRDEIVLLDYGSTDGLGHWVRTALLEALRDGRLQYFRAETRRWHMSRAKNIAHRLGTRPVLCNLDADNFAPAGFGDWLREVFLGGPAVTHADHQSYGGGYGRIAMLREDFRRLGGYDERLIGWGYDDEDLRRRAIASGLRSLVTPLPFMTFLRHSHAIRILVPGAKTQAEDLAFGRAISHRSLAEGRLHANAGKGWGRALVQRFDGGFVAS